MLPTRIDRTVRLAICLLTAWVAFPTAQPRAAEYSWTMSLEAGPEGAPLSAPMSLYIDEENERYYVADSGNNRLVSFGRDGRALLNFDADNQLERPIGLLKNGNNLLYVIDRGKDALTVINLQSQSIKSYTLKDGEQAISPQRLEITPDSLYILDKLSGAVFRTDFNFAIQTSYRCPDCRAGFVDFKITPDGLCGLGRYEGKLFFFDFSGRLTGETLLDAPMDFPVSFAIGKNGLIYVADRHAGQVALFSREGRLLGTVGSKGNAPGQLSYAAEIRIDPWNGFWIVDEGNGRVDLFRH